MNPLESPEAAKFAYGAEPSGNTTIDPEHIFIPAKIENPVTSFTEPVRGSAISMELVYVESRDGMYAPIGVRKPPGKGPFPFVVFAHMNGGMGTQWIREWTQWGSWTLEQFLGSGYAVCWTRYRAEIDNAYARGPKLVESKWQGRQLFNRGLQEYEDAIAIIEYVKMLPYVDTQRVGYVGLSHGGEMLMKIATEYHGLRCGIASEPASAEYLAARPAPRDPNTPPPPETYPQLTQEMLQKAVADLRARLDMPLAMERIRSITTPILVQGRDRDHNQATFLLNYELLKEAGKDVEWQSYDHDEHGFLFVRRNKEGVYSPDPIQLAVVKDSIAYMDRHLKA